MFWVYSTGFLLFSCGTARGEEGGDGVVDA
jgi:hypothetical protein